MRNRVAGYIIAILVVMVLVLYYRGNHLAKERDRFQENTDALLSDVKRLKVDSTTMAIDVKALRLSVKEYKNYRAADAIKIKEMGIRLKDLVAAGKIEARVDVPMDAALRDSVVVRDTLPELIQRIEIKNEYLDFYGSILNNRFSGNIHVAVNLQQAIWIEYKHKFLWWRWKVKAVHQTVSSDNPYVRILYSEFINIEK